jgi:hypothetical protein
MSEREMAKASTAKRRRTAQRVVPKKPRAIEDRTNDIWRRFKDEIIQNPMRWVFIGLGVGYLYGRFRR